MPAQPQLRRFPLVPARHARQVLDLVPARPFANRRPSSSRPPPRKRLVRILVRRRDRSRIRVQTHRHDQFRQDRILFRAVHMLAPFFADSRPSLVLLLLVWSISIAPFLDPSTSISNLCCNDHLPAGWRPTAPLEVEGVCVASCYAESSILGRPNSSTYNMPNKDSSARRDDTVLRYLSFSRHIIHFIWISTSIVPAYGYLPVKYFTYYLHHSLGNISIKVQPKY